MCRASSPNDRAPHVVDSSHDEPPLPASEPRGTRSDRIPWVPGSTYRIQTEYIPTLPYSIILYGRVPRVHTAANHSCSIDTTSQLPLTTYHWVTTPSLILSLLPLRRQSNQADAELKQGAVVFASQVVSTKDSLPLPKGWSTRKQCACCLFFHRCLFLVLHSASLFPFFIVRACEMAKG